MELWLAGEARASCSFFLPTQKSSKNKPALSFFLLPDQPLFGNDLGPGTGLGFQQHYPSFSQTPARELTGTEGPGRKVRSFAQPSWGSQWIPTSVTLLLTLLQPSMFPGPFDTWKMTSLCKAKSQISRNSLFHGQEDNSFNDLCLKLPEIRVWREWFEKHVRACSEQGNWGLRRQETTTLMGRSSEGDEQPSEKAPNELQSKM